MFIVWRCIIAIPIILTVAAASKKFSKMHILLPISKRKKTDSAQYIVEHIFSIYLF